MFLAMKDPPSACVFENLLKSYIAEKKISMLDSKVIVEIQRSNIEKQLTPLISVNGW